MNKKGKIANLTTTIRRERKFVLSILVVLIGVHVSLVFYWLKTGLNRVGQNIANTHIPSDASLEDVRNVAVQNCIQIVTSFYHVSFEVTLLLFWIFCLIICFLFRRQEQLLLMLADEWSQEKECKPNNVSDATSSSAAEPSAHQD
ncbi:MAG: hypothetical protein PHR77_20200 [Kiritimatiellae bacterium]|nr:hypothetical protein [Kiritimatiellia bacterium]MDD5520695.1 hypothetical protein [Kiritimatiellia bacterium]